MIHYAKGRILFLRGGNCFKKHLTILMFPRVPILRNKNRLGLVREYKTTGIPEGVPKPTAPLTRVKAARKKRRDAMSSPYKWLK